MLLLFLANDLLCGAIYSYLNVLTCQEYKVLDSFFGKLGTHIVVTFEVGSMFGVAGSFAKLAQA